jgi:hypothetical protein
LAFEILSLDFDRLTGCSICVVANTTAASHNLDAGLAAESYAVGFGAAVIGLMTI